MDSISIVIPIYNTEQYLEDCVESALNQTVPFKKIILINDGSTDNCLKICRGYEEKYSNVIIINQENLGLGRTRNVGIDYVLNNISKGYIMFLDSDDYLEKDSVEKIQRELIKNSLDILYFDASIKNELNIEMQNHYNRVGRVDTSVMNGKEYFIKNFPYTYVVQACMVVLKVDFLKKNKIKFPEERIYEDVFFTLKSMLKANRVKYIPEKLYVRRYRPNSIMTKQWTKEEIDGIYSVYKRTWRFLVSVEDASKDTLDSFKIFFIHSYLRIRKDIERVFPNEEEQENYVQNVEIEFLKYWNKIVKSSGTKLNNIYVLASIVRLVKNIENKSLLYNMFNNKCNYINIYKEELKGLLLTLPLDKTGFNIGIYGTGDHTGKLIYWYKKLVGEIKCDLYFIDTYKKSFEEKYQNVPIINIRDADQYVDIIIISSIYYENIMLNIIEEIYGDKIPVISFYEKRNYDLLVEVE